MRPHRGGASRPQCSDHSQMGPVSVRPLNRAALTKIKLQIETRSNPGANASVSKTHGPNKRKRIMPGPVRISEDTRHARSPPGESKNGACNSAVSELPATGDRPGGTGLVSPARSASPLAKRACELGSRAHCRLWSRIAYGG